MASAANADLTVAELHDPVPLASFLVRAGLAHLQPALGSQHTLGSLFLLSEDRTLMLSHLRQVGVEKLADRQKLTNAI